MKPTKTKRIKAGLVFPSNFSDVIKVEDLKERMAALIYFKKPKKYSVKITYFLPVTK